MITLPHAVNREVVNLLLVFFGEAIKHDMNFLSQDHGGVVSLES